MLKIFALAVIVSSIRCMPTGSANLGLVTARMTFFKVIKEKCYQNATDNEYDKFVNLTDSSVECVKNKMDYAPIYVIPAHDFKDNIQTCFDDFVIELEDCLPEEAKDWPQLNFDIVYSMIDFIYQNKDRLVSTNFRNYVSSCFENFQDDEARLNLMKCFTGYESQPLVAKALCQTMDEIENCTVTELNKRCPADASTEELKLKFIAALNEPCSDYDVTEKPVDMFTLLAPPNINPDLM